MEQQITNNLSREETQLLLLRDCSYMDASCVQRLRAAVEISLEWAEQTLDGLIQLDDNLQAFDQMLKTRIAFLNIPERLASEELDNQNSAVEATACPLEQNVQRLRNQVRDIMMSMQIQDVIGQAIERTASALEKRATAIEKGIEGAENSPISPNAIAEIHRCYRREDDLHRAGESDAAAYQGAA